MKVLIINSVCGIGSTGKIVVDLAKDFITNGDECIIAYGREKAPKEYESFSRRIGNDLTVRINGIKARLFDNEGFNAKIKTKKFIKWADEYNPDLVWLHNLHGYYINIELLFNWIKSKPDLKVKWTLHDCWAFTGHCTYFSYVKCDKWNDQCYNCPQIYNYPKSLFKDNSYNNYRKKKKVFCNVTDMQLIVPSNWLKNLIKNSFLSGYKIEVLYNKIDKSMFKPIQSNFRKKYHLEGKKIILGVANVWEDRKGLNDFIKLSSMLDKKYVIILIGLNKKQIKSLPENIIGIERTNNQEELAKAYTAADVFVNLSYEENYPTVLLEAQRCGTKCITYDSGGSRETINNTGAVVNIGDLKGIIREICKKIEN